MLEMVGKFIVALCLVFISPTGHADDRKVICQSDGSVTFVVDEGLEPMEERYRYLYDGERIAKTTLSRDKTILNGAYNIVASSFEDAKNLRGAEKDALPWAGSFPASRAEIVAAWRRSNCNIMTIQLLHHDAATNNLCIFERRYIRLGALLPFFPSVRRRRSRQNLADSSTILT